MCGSGMLTPNSSLLFSWWRASVHLLRIEKTMLSRIAKGGLRDLIKSRDLCFGSGR